MDNKNHIFGLFWAFPTTSNPHGSAGSNFVVVVALCPEIWACISLSGIKENATCSNGMWLGYSNVSAPLASNMCCFRHKTVGKILCDRLSFICPYPSQFWRKLLPIIDQNKEKLPTHIPRICWQGGITRWALANLPLREDFSANRSQQLKLKILLGLPTLNPLALCQHVYFGILNFPILV